MIQCCRLDLGISPDDSIENNDEPEDDDLSYGSSDYSSDSASSASSGSLDCEEDGEEDGDDVPGEIIVGSCAYTATKGKGKLEEGRQCKSSQEGS